MKIEIKTQKTYEAIDYYEKCDLCGTNTPYENTPNGNLPIGMYIVCGYIHDKNNKKMICESCFNKIFDIDKTK
jgi:hypothetical protein